MNTPNIIIAADWSKNASKRSLYEANVGERTVRRLDCLEWTLDSVLSVSRRYRGQLVLVSMDLVLGVPLRYWQQVRQLERWSQASDFLEWLRLLAVETEFWNTVGSSDEWSVAAPFYSVPKGKGSMLAFYESAGYDFYRDVDRRCRSNPMFCVSGIPGTVGSGTRAFWQELCPLLASDRNFSIWPFDGALKQLLSTPQVVLAEGYPGIAYTAALREQLPAGVLRVSKTKFEQRKRALEVLSAA